MKPTAFRFALLILLALSLVLTGPAAQVRAQTEPPTDTPTLASGARPVLVVGGYSYGDLVTPGATFDLNLTLKNMGNLDAANVVVTFSGEDFIPLDTGGVVAIPAIAGYDQGGKADARQPMLASAALWSKRVGIVTANVTYTDYAGTPYSSSFNITINVSAGSYSAQPTATPTPAGRSQIVVGGYQSDVEILQPGSMFTLSLDVTNLGNKDAKGVTMVLGGGTIPQGNETGTPVPGGISGSGSDLATFAPLGSSNVIYLGDLAAGGTLSTDNELIVNVTAQPGAYPFKISFIYTDEKNNRLVDDQVITLLVYRLPQVEVSFYADPGFFSVGMPMPLPLQVTNLGKNTAVLGNLRITSEGNEVQNNVALVGALEPGGYFPWDAMFIPSQPGTQEVQVVIAYTDDFNQTREITQTLTVEVQDAPMIDPSMDPSLNPGMDPGMNPGVGPDGMPIDGGNMPVDVGQTGSLWQKVLRALKGLIGLGSGAEQPEQFPGEMMPEEALPDGGKPVMPMPKG